MTPGDGWPAYEPPDDLWVVACHYNPLRYASALGNLRTFLAVLEASRMNRLVVECAFGDAPFELPPAPWVVQVRARDLMWQKERLLNLAVGRLPASCRKVAWLDCDILFDNPSWAVRTSELLEEFAVVQPFTWSVWLGRGGTREGGGGECLSFGAVYRHDPELSRLIHYDRHGHTGFAWAARRELLDRHGLYDGCIAGGGDHLAAHGFCGHLDEPCVAMITGPDGSPHREHYRAWADPVARDVAGRIAAAPGSALHLWHGDLVNRGYVQRHRDLSRLAFDPAADLRRGPTGCWEWGRENPELRRWMADYFRNRREDGDPPGSGRVA
jgi:hypothetical protein